MKNMFSYLAARTAAVVLTTSLALVGCQPVEIESPVSSTRSDANARLSAGVDYVDGELLVQFAEGLSDDVKNKLLAKIKGQPIEKILTEAMQRAGKKEGVLLIKVNKKVLEAIADLQNIPGVEIAEPNFIYKHAAVAEDPYFKNGTLWGLYGPSTSPANQYGSNAAAAWAAGVTGSASVYIGVIDEGIQLTHPELSGQVWTNPNEPVDGKDNDGNGYKDDVNGWDFDRNDRTIYDGGSQGLLDDHGTHVAGTIGGKANNGIGIVGVNWKVTLISAKFLGFLGGTTAGAIKAVDYLTDLKKNRGINVVASNNSWGGGGYSQALFDAISRANTAGIMFIAAAGNDGTNNDATPSYPANYNLPNVISVAAINKTGGLASFSQFGAATVDIGAPGVEIASTTAFNTGEIYSGTSMATPHVTGAVALYASTHPGASVAQIRNAILSSAVPTPSLSGKTVTGGRLDANAALSK